MNDSGPPTYPFVLLPGLHGTEGLFDDFIASAPEGVRCLALVYPNDVEATYASLCRWICERLAMASGLVLIGESFSGPLALMVAQQLGERVRAVVLVATFVVPPRMAWARYLPLSLMFRVAIPLARRVGRWFTRPLWVGLARELEQAVPGVWGHRLKQCLAVDARPALVACQAPVLYLRAERDLLVPRSASERVRANLPSVRVEGLATSHFLLQERPEEAWGRICSFLEGGED